MKDKELTNNQLSKIKSFISLTNGKKVLEYYILPMVGIRVNEFDGSTNIDSVHINKEGTLVYLKLKRTPFYLERRAKSFENFQFTVDILGTMFFVFKVPDLMLEEFQILIAGKYTEFQSSTREAICKLSGLPFNLKVRKNSLSETHPFIQALFLDSPVREILAIYTGVPLSSMPNEVISKLEDTSTVYIENWVKQQ